MYRLLRNYLQKLENIQIYIFFTWMMYWLLRNYSTKTRKYSNIFFFVYYSSLLSMSMLFNFQNFSFSLEYLKVYIAIYFIFVGNVAFISKFYSNSSNFCYFISICVVKRNFLGELLFTVSWMNILFNIHSILD